MIIKYDGETYVKLPYVVGEEVYICTIIDWKKGIVKGIICDMEIWWNKQKEDFYCRIYVDHEHIRSDKNPNMIINRYIFFESELAKTYEEACQKVQNRELQEQNRKDVNTL